MSVTLIDSLGNILSTNTNSLTVTQTEVDFGSTPVPEGTFTVVDSTVNPGSRIIAQVAYEAPTNKDVDEVEMDDLGIRCQPGSGQFTMFIHAADGSYLAGTFKINYYVGS